MTTQVASHGHRSFVVKYNNILTPLWYNTFEISTNTLGYNVGVLKIDHKNVFVTGYFYNDIVIDSVSFNFGSNSFHEYIAEICDVSGSFQVPIGIEEKEFPNVNIFPNPAVESLNIEGVLDGKCKLYEIYNSSGELLFFQQGCSNKIYLESIKFTNGLYLLKISFNDGKSKKIKFNINK